MKKLFLTIITTFLLGLNSLFTQNIDNRNISSNILNLLQEFSEQDTIKINVSGKIEDENALKLKKDATKDELIILTNNSNPIIRFYSIYFLTQNHDSLPYLDIAKKHLKDTALIKINEWQFASHGPPDKEVYLKKLNEIFIELIGVTQVGDIPLIRSYQNWPYLSRSKIGNGKIDSLLLCEPNYLSYSKKLFFSNIPVKGCYECVHKEIITNKNHNAIVLLSAYQNKKDIELIIQNVGTGSLNDIRMKFNAFINFQNPKLFHFLKQNTDKYYQIDNYLRAVAKYKNEDALKTLKKVFEKVNNNTNMNYLKSAIQENFTKIYSDLLFEILETELSPFFNFPDELWQYDKERTFNLLLKIMEKDYNRSCGNLRRKMMIGKVEKSLKENAPDLIIRFDKIIKE